MKRILFIFVLFFMLFVRVDAAGLTVSGSNVKVGGKFTINISNVKENSDYKLIYDYDLISVESLSGGISSSSSIKSDGSLVFRVNNSLKLEEDKKVEIILEDKNKNDETKTINIVIKANNSKTTTKSTTKKTEVTTTTAKKSNDATLSLIGIVDNDAKTLKLSPEFKPDVLEYTVKVEGKVKKVFIDARANNEKAIVNISDNANKELQMGENKIVITVSAEDGTNKLYTLKIIKEVLDTNATLKSLSINNHPEFEFDSNKFEYDLKLNSGEKELMFSFSASDKAKVNINNNYELKEGSVVRIIVEAEDGTKKQYSINIIDKKTAAKKEVAADKDPLIIIILSLVAVLLTAGIIIVRVKKR